MSPFQSQSSECLNVWMFECSWSCCLALIGFSAFLGQNQRQITTKIIWNPFANQFESSPKSSDQCPAGIRAGSAGLSAPPPGAQPWPRNEEEGGGEVKLPNFPNPPIPLHPSTPRSAVPRPAWWVPGSARRPSAAPLEDRTEKQGKRVVKSTWSEVAEK